MDFIIKSLEVGLGLGLGVGVFLTIIYIITSLISKKK